MLGIGGPLPVMATKGKSGDSSNNFWIIDPASKSSTSLPKTRYIPKFRLPVQDVPLGYSHRPKTVLINRNKLATLIFLQRPIILTILFPLPIYNLRPQQRRRRLLLPRRRCAPRPLTTPPLSRSEPTNARLPLSRRISPLRPPWLTICAPKPRLVGRSMLWHWCNLSICSYSGWDMGFGGRITAVASLCAPEAAAEFGAE